jgi:hypothetical protein
VTGSLAFSVDASGMLQFWGTKVRGARYNEVVVLHSCAIGNECQVPCVACTSDRQAWKPAAASRSIDCGTIANAHVPLASRDSAPQLEKNQLSRSRWFNPHVHCATLCALRALKKAHCAHAPECEGQLCRCERCGISGVGCVCHVEVPWHQGRPRRGRRAVPAHPH